MLLALLDWVYGPAAATDPYYAAMRDIIVLIPGWYLWLWVAIGAAGLGFRWLRRHRRNHRARLGARRVRSRTERVLKNQSMEIAARRLRRRPANDWEVVEHPHVA